MHQSNKFHTNNQTEKSQKQSPEPCLLSPNEKEEKGKAHWTFAIFYSIMQPFKSAILTAQILAIKYLNSTNGSNSARVSVQTTPTTVTPSRFREGVGRRDWERGQGCAPARLRNGLAARVGFVVEDWNEG